MTYALHVPFSLAPPMSLGGVESAQPISIGGHGAALSTSSLGYQITITSVANSDEAEKLVPNVWAGLTRAFFDHSSAFSGSFAVEPGISVTPAAASGLHGLLPTDVRHVVPDGATVIVPEGVRTARFGVNTPTVTNSLPADRFLTSFGTGAGLPTAAELFAEERLRTAVDLLCASYYEQSRPAKFLTMSVALEVILPITYKDLLAQSLIARWRADVAAERTIPGRTPSDLASLGSLERELLFARRHRYVNGSAST